MGKNSARSAVIPAARPSALRAALQYWNNIAADKGPSSATRSLFAQVVEFVRDSTPSRLRQRYGDADYDWDHRVNTTSAAVAWRDRLLGAFHSPYQPTEPALFHEMLDALASQLNLAQPNRTQPRQTQSGEAFRDFTFLDLGSGKGRTLLMASDYPFRRIVGVELLPVLHEIAEENLRQYKSDTQRCFSLESVCADATTFPFLEDPIVVYLFNPFPEAGLRKVMMNLERSLRANPRPAFVLYHNPLLEHVLTERTVLRKIGGTHQYSVFGTSGVW